MSDLIERDALLKDLKSDCPESDVCIAETSCIECIIGRQPTIEAEPVRHGRWINDTFCSECNRFPVDVSFNVSNQKLAKYFSRCPHCGAKMDGGEENA